MFKAPVVTQEFMNMREEVKRQNPGTSTDDNSNSSSDKGQEKNDLYSVINMRRQQAEENFEKIAKSTQDSINNLQGNLQTEELKKTVDDLKKGLDVAAQSTQEIWQKYGIDLNAWAKNQGNEATDITKNLGNITVNTQKAMQNIRTNLVNDLKNIDLQKNSFEENREILQSTTEKNLNELRDTFKSGISEAQSQFYEDSDQDLNKNMTEDQPTESSAEQKSDTNNEQSQKTKNSSDESEQYVKESNKNNQDQSNS